jgi:hypothetical protein
MVSLSTIVRPSYNLLDNLLDNLPKPNHMTWKQFTKTILTAKFRLVTLGITVRALDGSLDGSIEGSLEDTNFFTSRPYKF